MKEKLTEQDIQDLRRCLEFYSNPNNWKSPSKGFALQYDPEPSPINIDRGTVARLAMRIIQNK